MKTKTAPSGAVFVSAPKTEGVATATPARSMRHSEPLLQVARVLQLVNNGHGQVGHADLAGLVTVHQRVLGAQAVSAGALAGLQQDGG